CWPARGTRIGVGRRWRSWWPAASTRTPSGWTSPTRPRWRRPPRGSAGPTAGWTFWGTTRGSPRTAVSPRRPRPGGRRCGKRSEERRVGEEGRDRERRGRRKKEGESEAKDTRRQITEQQ